MKLYISHENYQIAFILKDKNHIIDTFSFKENEDLSKKFLILLDKFLKKCNTNIVSVKKVELKQKKTVGLTSQRIVKSIVQVLNFVRKESKCHL